MSGILIKNTHHSLGAHRGLFPKNQTTGQMLSSNGNSYQYGKKRTSRGNFLLIFSILAMLVTWVRHCTQVIGGDSIYTGRILLACSVYRLAGYLIIVKLGCSTQKNLTPTLGTPKGGRATGIKKRLDFSFHHETNDNNIYCLQSQKRRWYLLYSQLSLI